MLLNRHAWLWDIHRTFGCAPHGLIVITWMYFPPLSKQQSKRVVNQWSFLADNISQTWYWCDGRQNLMRQMFWSRILGRALIRPCKNQNSDGCGMFNGFALIQNWLQNWAALQASTRFLMSVSVLSKEPPILTPWNMLSVALPRSRKGLLRNKLRLT